MTHEAIINGYGDIYIQLKKKLTKKSFLKKKIESILRENQEISSLDIYGIINGLLISGSRHIPVYLLSCYKMESKKFLNNSIPDKNSCWCGEVLYKKYNNEEKKKIVIITGENQKKKTLFFEAMPISFYQRYNFGWDEWNEKAIIIPIEKIESYFEVPTIEFIHVYVNNKKKINEILSWIKNKLTSEIGYVDLGIKVLPEYNKFLVLITIISHGILLLLFSFSYFLLLILINLYLYQNKNEFYYLIITGIKKFHIGCSLILFFFLLVLLSLFFGFLLGYISISILNYFHCIVISAELQSYFFCVIDWQVIYYYSLLYLFLLLSSVYYYYNKYAIK